VIPKPQVSATFTAADQPTDREATLSAKKVVPPTFKKKNSFKVEKQPKSAKKRQKWRKIA
jgi:hypothetical protein